MNSKLLFMLPLFLATFYAAAQTSDTIYNPDYLMDPQKWQAVDERTGNAISIDTLTYNGKKAFHIPGWGMMGLNNLDFKNLVMEADVAGNMAETMTGFGFRAQDFENFEYTYLRLMASNAYDAIQYLPVYNITIPWVLYSQYQATATINSGWTHLKIEVIDKQLKVFVNNNTAPNLIVQDLKGDSTRGMVMLISEFNDAYYANLTIKKLSDDTLSPVPPTPKDIFIKDWQLSGTFGIANPTVEHYHSIADTTSVWQIVSPDNDGLINISKYFNNPTGTAILKKTIVTSDVVNATLLFDYTRKCEIILNDSILYYGFDNNETEMVEDEKYFRVTLDSGENTLAFIVTGDYGNYINYRKHFDRYQSQNWGLIARIDTFKAMDVSKWKAVDEKNNNSITFSTLQYNGKQCFRIVPDEIAVLQTDSFKNFILEADVYGIGWPGFGFHVTDSCNFDQFYFRMDESNKNGAIQYVSVSNGAVSWALYTNYKAKTTYIPNSWNHLKIIVIDNQAKVYVNDNTSPDMAVNILRGHTDTGRILLEGVSGSTYIANFSVSALSDDLTSYKFADPEKTNIKSWSLSGNFERTYSLSLYDYHTITDTITHWKTIYPHTDGVVNVAEYFKIPRGTAILKTTIEAVEDTVKNLLFDYTRGLEIILNDSIIYSAFQDVEDVRDDSHKLIINLKQGQNELAFVIAGDYTVFQNYGYPHFNHYQSFNWGFKARYEDVEIATPNHETESPQSGVLIFPNPSRDILNIHLGHLRGTPTRVEICNLSGQVVYNNTINSDAAIDVSGMQKGSCIVRITGADGKIMAKTIIFE